MPELQQNDDSTATAISRHRSILTNWYSIRSQRKTIGRGIQPVTKAHDEPGIVYNISILETKTLGETAKGSAPGEVPQR